MGAVCRLQNPQEELCAPLAHHGLWVLVGFVAGEVKALIAFIHNTQAMLQTDSISAMKASVSAVFRRMPNVLCRDGLSLQEMGLIRKLLVAGRNP